MTHLTMRPEDRRELAKYIAEGVPFDDILDKIKRTCPNEQLSYLHYITKMDLHNIARDFSLSKSKCLPRNDAENVASWMESIHSGMQNETFNLSEKDNSSNEVSRLKAELQDNFRFILSAFEREENTEKAAKILERVRKISSYVTTSACGDDERTMPSSSEEPANKTIKLQSNCFLVKRKQVSRTASMNNHMSKENILPELLVTFL